LPGPLGRAARAFGDLDLAPLALGVEPGSGGRLLQVVVVLRPERADEVSHIMNEALPAVVGCGVASLHLNFNPGGNAMRPADAMRPAMHRLSELLGRQAALPKLVLSGSYYMFFVWPALPQLGTALCANRSLDTLEIEHDVVSSDWLVAFCCRAC